MPTGSSFYLPYQYSSVSLTTVPGMTTPINSGLQYNVMEYGAVGDGITDDTAAIQACINSVPAYIAGFGGASVYFPPAKYLISSSLMLGSGVTLVGYGVVSSFIQGTVAGPLITTSSDGTENILTNHVGIEKITVLNLSNSASASAVTFIQTVAIVCKDCAFTSIGGYYMHVMGGWLMTFIECNFAGSSAALIAAYIDGTTVANTINMVRFYSCGFQNAQVGLCMNGGTELVLEGCHFEKVSGGNSSMPASLWVNGVAGGTITGCYFDTNSCWGIGAGTSLGLSTGFLVAGNYLVNCQTYFIQTGSFAYSSFLSNAMQGGSLDPNISGIDDYVGSATTGNTYLGQQFTNSTGIALNVNTVGIVLNEGLGISLYGTAATSAYTAFTTMGSNDIWTRWRMDTAGTATWGGGANQPDCQLSRTGVGAMLWNGINGASTLSMQVNGPIGVNGASPPAKAANPGTATGTDATVINAITTILKNAGFCS